MSAGLGIFMGCVVIGTVLLYLKTREQWNWRTITKRTFISIGVLVALVIVVVLGVLGYGKWTQRAKVVTSLKGVTIGEKWSDVVFKQGPFEKIDPSKDAVKKYEDEVNYENKEKRLNIGVRNGVVTEVWYSCEKETDFSDLNRIYCYDSGDKIIQMFGDKVRVLCPKRNEEGATLLRVYDVVKYGTRYLLYQNVVRSFFITDKRSLESYVGLNWDACK